MKESREQLEKLLGRFYDKEQAARAASEIEGGDALVAGGMSPRPRPEIIAHIKASLEQELAVRAKRKIVSRRILTAAAACLLAAISVLWVVGHHRILPSESPVAIGTTVIQEFFSDDAVSEISSILDDISKQIYDEEIAGKNDSWETDAGNEIEEMTLIAQADFWKG
ncbi:MAG TPA: hypothetical protein P5017_00180 [Anaerohalosphaeraceae bacterium]|nr:hypothetical protein [Anaerohalosphaeraceae bacterium]